MSPEKPMRRVLAVADDPRHKLRGEASSLAAKAPGIDVVLLDVPSGPALAELASDLGRLAKTGG